MKYSLNSKGDVVLTFGSDVVNLASQILSSPAMQQLDLSETALLRISKGLVIQCTDHLAAAHILENLALHLRVLRVQGSLGGVLLDDLSESAARLCYLAFSPRFRTPDANFKRFGFEPTDLRTNTGAIVEAWGIQVDGQNLFIVSDDGLNITGWFLKPVGETFSFETSMVRKIKNSKDLKILLEVFDIKPVPRPTREEQEDSPTNESSSDQSDEDNDENPQEPSQE